MQAKAVSPHTALARPLFRSLGPVRGCAPEPVIAAPAEVFLPTAHNGRGMASFCYLRS